MVNFGITTYLLSDISGNTKIGKTKDPSKRIRALCCGNPTARLLLLIAGDHERELHQRYIHKRVTGEWYSLTDDDIAELSQTEKILLDNRGGTARYSFVK